MADERTATVKYRILSKAPGDRRFKFRAFSGAKSEDLDRIHNRLERFVTESPGWQFKVQTRTVVTITPPWKDMRDG